MIVIGASLAAFVYLGATVIDARVGALMTDVQSALKAEMQSGFDLIDCLCAPSAGGTSVLDLLAAVALLLVLFSGLPLAGMALAIERSHRRPPYWCLALQIVSCGFSALMLTIFTAVGMSEWREPPFIAFTGYFSVQLIAGLAAIPVWRRLVVYPSRESILQT
jgi:hypothetical protein